MSVGSEKLKILVVEDDVIVGTHLSEILTNEGYEVTDLLTNGEEAIKFFKSKTVDLVLMDVKLGEGIDGIETATQLYQSHKTPVIFVTANADEQTFSRAKNAFPFAFIQKPFKPDNLLQTIEVAFNKIFEVNENEEESQKTGLQIDDRVFIKDGSKMTKVILKDILYVEADRNYCSIFTESKTFVLSVPLKKFEAKIASPLFQRTHRSYLVNLNHVDAVDEFGLIINDKTIPISRQFKSKIMKQLNIV